MSPSAKDKSLSYALLALAVILGATLFAQGWRGSRTSEILRTPARKIAVATLPETLNLADDLQIIQNRALFYATRRFYEPALATPVTTVAQLSSYQLMGTLLLPQRPGVAFVRRGPGDDTTTVSPGDHLDGWTVKAVQNSIAIFGYGDQRVTLTVTSPFGSSPAGQGVTVVRVRTAQPLRRQPSTEHTPQGSIQRGRHHA